MSSPGSSTSKQLHNFELPDLWRSAGRLRDRRRAGGSSPKPPPDNQETEPPTPPTEKNGEKKKEKEEETDALKLPKFSLQLNLQEISEDIYALTGKMPSRNMKKNPKNVQKQIDLIFPGGKLEKITLDRYRVSKKNTKARY